MIRIDIKRTQLFNEMSVGLQDEYFKVTKNKYLHNIDTFYYSVYLKNDSNDIKNDVLFNQLNIQKSITKAGKEIGEFIGLQVKAGSFAMVYNFRLSNPDMYDIFIADYLPNVNTPRIVVQIRSMSLWLRGEVKSITDSYNKVLEIVNLLNCEVLKVLENRIDYAFHTNSIQNPYKFFSDENLEKYLDTTLTKYYKIGDIRNKEFTLDYFALGQLKSNNLFNRNYNKSKEVIELNYKPFFFDIWHQEGIISKYDKYCLKYAYVKKNYYAIAEARLNFYLEHGADDHCKNDIRNLLSDSVTRYNDVINLADLLTPQITTVLNIEFMTKRKFYYYADEHINHFSAYSEGHRDLMRVFKVIDNREVFIDYITDKSISFRSEEGDYLDFWKRLRSLKISTDYHKNTGKYKRIRNDSLDKQRKLQQCLSNISTNSLYNSKVDTSLKEDLSFLLSQLNDNDMKYDLVLIEKDTGEVVKENKALISDKFSYKYKQNKDKKFKLLKNRLEKIVENKKDPKGGPTL